MKPKKTSRLATLFAVAAFAVAHPCHAGEIDCDATNSTDFRIDSFDLEFNGAPPSFTIANFHITNIGPTPNFDPIWFNVYELDINNVRVNHIGRVFSNSFVTPGSQLVRGFVIPNTLLTFGTTYEGEIEYACETNLSNNTATLVLTLPDELFDNGFESAATTPGNALIGEIRLPDVGFEILWVP